MDNFTVLNIYTNKINTTKMKNASLLSIMVFLIILSHVTNGQERKTNLTIQFPLNLEVKDISFQIDDGKDEYKKINVKIQNNKGLIVENFFSTYATIFIRYRTNKNSYSTSFWISERPAKITFNSMSFEDNWLKKYTLTNAQNTSDIKAERNLNRFTAEADLDLKNFLANNLKWNSNDSLIILFEAKNKKLADKKLEFVRKNGDEYYSFWLFRRELVYSDANIDTLINIYNSVFPVKFKNSFEGKEAEKVLYGRSLKKGKIAPDFTMQDIAKMPISLSKHKGKYVLLNFWASWCTPCIEEFPAIKKIRENFNIDRLEIISVNLDSDSLKFRNAIEKYQMNWLHISSNTDLLKKYAVTGIPVLYLINQNGEIVYSRDEEKDFSLNILSTFLKEKLQD